MDRLKDDISLNVANTYLNVLFNKENLELAKSQVDFSKFQVDQIKTLARAQGASESDLMEFEKRIKEIEETNLQDKDDDLLKTKNELSSIFGININEELDLLFEVDPEKKWKDALKKTGIDFSKLSNYFGNA